MGYEILNTSEYSITCDEEGIQIPNIYIGCIDEHNNICKVSNLDNSDYSTLYIEGKNKNNNTIQFLSISAYVNNKRDEYAYNIMLQSDGNDSSLSTMTNLYLWNNDGTTYVSDSYITIYLEPYFCLNTVLGGGSAILNFNRYFYMFVFVDTNTNPCTENFSGISVPVDFEDTINKKLSYGGGWPSYSASNTVATYLRSILYHPVTGEIYSTGEICDIFKKYTGNSLSQIDNITTLYNSAPTKHTVFCVYSNDMTGSVLFHLIQLDFKYVAGTDAYGNSTRNYMFNAYAWSNSSDIPFS